MTGRAASVLVGGSFVLAGGAAGFAVHEAVVANADIDHRLAEAAKFFALAGTFRLFALRTFVSGGTGSGAHATYCNAGERRRERDGGNGSGRKELLIVDFC
jgi:hypothetical protein